MPIFDRFRRQPLQPDLAFAAKGFAPIMAMQIQQMDVDLYAMADAYGDALAKDGIPLHQVRSARWGGVTAIGQDINLFASFLASYDDAMKESGIEPNDDKEHAKSKYQSAALMMVTLVMADSPDEYARFLQYIGAL